MVIIQSSNTNPIYEKSKSQKVKDLMIKSSEAKTFESWLNVKLKLTYEENNKELEIILKSIKEKYKKFQKIGIGIEEGWRGKSSIEIIKHPDKIIVYKFRKFDKGEEPKKVAIEISKDEINACLIVLGKLQIGDDIESKQIFMGISRILNLGHTSWDNGDKPFETDRILHNRFTTLLSFLENEKLIKYSRRGKVKLINNKISIQTLMD